MTDETTSQDEPAGPMTAADERKAAKAIHDHLKKNPEATVPEIAAKLEVSEDDVVRVMTTYRVEDGKPKEAGPGQGGDWVPPADPPEEEPAAE